MSFKLIREIRFWIVGESLSPAAAPADQNALCELSEVLHSGLVGGCSVDAGLLNTLSDPGAPSHRILLRISLEGQRSI